MNILLTFCCFEFKCSPVQVFQTADANDGRYLPIEINRSGSTEVRGRGREREMEEKEFISVGKFLMMLPWKALFLW